MCSLWKGFWCGGKPSLSYTSLTFSICCCLKGKYWLSFVLSLFFFKASMLWRLTRCQVFFLFVFLPKKWQQFCQTWANECFYWWLTSNHWKQRSCFIFLYSASEEKARSSGKWGVARQKGITPSSASPPCFLPLEIIPVYFANGSQKLCCCSSFT